MRRFTKNNSEKAKIKYVYKNTPFFKVYHETIIKNKKPHKTKKPFLKQLFYFGKTPEKTLVF